MLLGTRNDGKIAEIFQILGDVSVLELLTYEAVPFADVAETGATFRDNARLKANQISTETGLPVLAEDSGLEVNALNGAPGVHTARYAGEGATDESNIEKLLAALDGVQDRSARFVCVAVLRWPDGTEQLSEGQLCGRIARTPRGNAGFGYDPVFVPDGYERTLAELGEGVKGEISHRRDALDEMRRALLHGLSSAD